MIDFCHYDKIAEINNLQEERFILAHSCRSFNLWPAVSIAFRPVASQKHLDRRV
jgi:hypothetical protein